MSSYKDKEALYLSRVAEWKSKKEGSQKKVQNSILRTSLQKTCSFTVEKKTKKYGSTSERILKERGNKSTQHRMKNHTTKENKTSDSHLRGKLEKWKERKMTLQKSRQAVLNSSVNIKASCNSNNGKKSEKIPPITRLNKNSKAIAAVSVGKVITTDGCVKNTIKNYEKRPSLTVNDESSKRKRAQPVGKGTVTCNKKTGGRNRSKSVGTMLSSIEEDKKTKCILKSERRSLSRTCQLNHKSKVHFISPLRFSPKQCKKTPSTAEATLRNRLNSWLQSKGKTPSRCHHLMCFGETLSTQKQKTTACGLSVDQLSQQESKVKNETVQQNLAADFEMASDEHVIEDTSSGTTVNCKLTFDKNGTFSENVEAKMSQIMELFEAGCPKSNALQWLDEIAQDVPSVKALARFWLNRISIIRSSDNGSNEAVLVEFENAIIHQAKPGGEMAAALRNFVTTVQDKKLKDNCQDLKGAREHGTTNSGGMEQHMGLSDFTLEAKSSSCTSSSIKNLQEKNVFESSAIKYAVAHNTPFLMRMRNNSCLSIENIPSAVVTPVRRSTRKSTSMLPRMLQDHGVVIESLDKLDGSHKSSAIFQSNDNIL